jgi:hypothetical protein
MTKEFSKRVVCEDMRRDVQRNLQRNGSRNMGWATQCVEDIEHNPRWCLPAFVLGEQTL